MLASALATLVVKNTLYVLLPSAISVITMQSFLMDSLHLSWTLGEFLESLIKYVNGLTHVFGFREACTEEAEFFYTMSNKLILQK